MVTEELGRTTKNKENGEKDFSFHNCAVFFSIVQLRL